MGSVAKTITTLYDGFYLADMVPYGSYSIRISAQQLARLGFKPQVGQQININKSNPSINDIDFVIEQIII